MMRSEATATGTIDPSSVNNPTSRGASPTNSTVTTSGNSVLYQPVIQTAFSARWGWLAPRF